MPHFLLVSFLYEPFLGGGASIVPYNLSQSLKERGNTISLFTTSSNKKLGIENKDGITIYRFPSNNIYWVFEKDTKSILQKTIWQLIDTWNPFFYRQGINIIEEIKPDIVHVHKLRGISPSIWNAAANCGIPVVHTSHDFELISPQGTLNGVIGQMARKRSFLMRPYQTIRAKASSVVNYATAPSQFNLALHTQTGYFNKARKSVIPNSHGYSLERLSIIKTKNKDVPGKNNFLFIGRLDVEKGILLLCDVFERILQKFPQAELHIIGGGPLEDTICERSKKITNIQFHGPMFGEQKEKMLGNCTAVIVPSSAYETFGIVITEAYAFGKPVIASRIGGIPEIVREGITGWLVQPGDATELQNAIENVLENPAMAEAMSLACFDEAQRYASEIVFQQYMDLYSQG